MKGTRVLYATTAGILDPKVQCTVVSSTPQHVTLAIGRGLPEERFLKAKADSGDPPERRNCEPSCEV